jgi:hypothetical protein
MIIWGATPCPDGYLDCFVCNRAIEVPDDARPELDRSYNPRHVPSVIGPVYNDTGRSVVVMAPSREGFIAYYDKDGRYGPLADTAYEYPEDDPNVPRLDYPIEHCRYD